MHIKAVKYEYPIVLQNAKYAQNMQLKNMQKLTIIIFVVRKKDTMLVVTSLDHQNYE